MTREELQAENAELRRRLEEAEETLQAIRDGAVDAFVVAEPGGDRVYTLDGADRPYRLLVEEMQQGAATLQADGTIVWCNRRLAELLGVAHERLIGAALHDFIAPDDRSAYDDLLLQGGSGSSRGEAHMRRTDGAPLPAHLTFNVLSKGCGAAIGVLVTDLTAQRHQERLAAAHETLRASEARLREQSRVLHAERERLRVTLTSIGDAVISTDTAGRVTFLNGVAEAMTGWKSGEAAQQPLDVVFRIVDEGSRETVENPVTRALREGQTVGLTIHTVLLSKDGTERPIDDSAAPIRDEQGQIVGCVLTFRDVAEQRQTEKRIYSLMIELREADRRKDEFLATLAHELRGPLAPLSNGLEILKRAGGDGELVRQARGTMERQLTQMVRLVDDLLDVSRITRDLLELRKKRIELAAAIQQSVEACRPLIESCAHEVVVQLPSQSVYLDADPVRLTQVFSNLLNNACKYTDRGGKISVTAELHGDEVVVGVKDNGTGIPHDMLESVFEMFTQVDRRLERSQGGLGIGLSLVKRLVGMHGGSIEAKSDGPGRGSEFVVRLPVLTDKRTVKAFEPVASKTQAMARRILVVDDNRDSAASLAMLLKTSGNETHTAHDGLEALAAAEKLHPDVVLLDIGLPKLSGFDVCHRIRAQSWGRNILIVALSGWGQEADRLRSKDSGFDAHMVKPLDYAALMQLLAPSLGSAGSR